MAPAAEGAYADAVLVSAVWRSAYSTHAKNHRIFMNPADVGVCLIFQCASSMHTVEKIAEIHENWQVVEKTDEIPQFFGAAGASHDSPRTPNVHI